MEDYFSVYLFNVGAGDNILLQFPNGEYGLIDFFYTESYNESIPPSVAFFKKFKPKGGKLVISFICFSHYDADHIKGVKDFWKFVNDSGLNFNIDIKNIWLAGAKDLDHFKEIILGKFSNRFTISEDKLLRLNVYDKRFNILMDDIRKWKKITGRSEYFIRGIGPVHEKLPNNFISYSIAPLDKSIEVYDYQSLDAALNSIFLNDDSPTKGDRNSISSIFYLQYNDYQWVFGGDATKRMWIDGLDEADKRTNYKLNSDFIKVSHHGSKKSSHTLIWNKLIESKKKCKFCYFCWL